jgi:uncharacterized UBP type Zn finger protein
MSLSILLSLFSPLLFHLCCVLRPFFLFKTSFFLSFQGFKNIGNTCYLNSVIQSLFSLENFVSLLNVPSTDATVMMMQKVLALYRDGGQKSIDLTLEISFLRPGHFSPGEQQDACELFVWIIGAMQNASPNISENFEVIEQNMFECDCDT